VLYLATNTVVSRLYELQNLSFVGPNIFKQFSLRIATGLRTGRPGFKSRQGTGILRHHYLIDSGVHSVPYSISTGDFFFPLWVMKQMPEADQSFSPSSKL